MPNPSTIIITNDGDSSSAAKDVVVSAQHQVKGPDSIGLRPGESVRLIAEESTVITVTQGDRQPRSDAGFTPNTEKERADTARLQAAAAEGDPKAQAAVETKGAEPQPEPQPADPDAKFTGPDEPVDAKPGDVWNDTHDPAAHVRRTRTKSGWSPKL